jgi:hypothetical protein
MSFSSIAQRNIAFELANKIYHFLKVVCGMGWGVSQGSLRFSFISESPYR